LTHFVQWKELVSEYQRISQATQIEQQKQTNMGNKITKKDLTQEREIQRTQELKDKLLAFVIKQNTKLVK